MEIKSLKQLPILSESVTIDVTPLSLYGRQNDLAKITANIKLAQPLAQDTKFLLPNCDSIKTPKVYLPDGTPIVNTFDPTTEVDVNNLVSSMQDSLKIFSDSPTNENMNNLVKIITAYNEMKQYTQALVIPAGQQYITFSYSKDIANDPTTKINTLETIVPLSSFTLNNQPGSKANIMILMPFELTDMNNISVANWTAPNGTPQELIKQTQAGRIVLSQYWQYDPSVVVKYKY
ncbi:MULTISPECIES: hypothetical protein [Clostridium]|uniref:Uncharacterized protein n=1 Tax=Clostridium beijerinckii TaxID=1520 RepID=A0A7X9SST8_CLOBE|nr:MULTISPECIES: hypothetical protein [Clostridium]NMF07330.1 hypothetical protein [Clostridium beijerinckii]